MENTPVADGVTAPKRNVLFEVTIVSKTLAAILFIILPFLGGWIGWQYSQSEIRNASDKSNYVAIPITDTGNYVPEAGYVNNSIETIDGIVEGVIVSTSSAYFYEEQIPSDIVLQTNQGYKRFTGPSYQFTTPSDYLYKDNTIFYLPLGAAPAINPIELISNPKSFKTFTDTLALGDGMIYYKGTEFQKSDTLEMLLWDYYLSESTIFMLPDSDPEPVSSNIKIIFENVDSTTLAPVDELRGSPYNFTKDKGDGIFQDTQFLYCIKSGNKIVLPVKITFTPPEEFDPYNQFISWTDSSGSEGSISFTETTTGHRYNDACEQF